MTYTLYELHGGPQDGGLLTVDGQPPAVIFADWRPSDVGWHTGQRMTADRLRIAWGRKPVDRKHSRYMWSEVEGRYVYDETVSTK